MSFDTLAPIYRLLESIFAGRKMQRCRVLFLDRIPEPKNILMAGEGPGRFLIPCRIRFPKAQITLVDGSAGMIAQARQSLTKAGLESRDTQFVHADIFDWAPPVGNFDLIVTHFFLDCFHEDQLDALVPKLAQAATPNAHWLIADFQIAASGLMRLRSRVIVAMLYAFFRFTTRLPASKLVDPDPLLERAGFKLKERRKTDWGLIKSDWWRR
jgi:ubiquinone/menaquinone biosynthesis C-methylase UbiE